MFHFLCLCKYFIFIVSPLYFIINDYKLLLIAFMAETLGIIAYAVEQMSKAY